MVTVSAERLTRVATEIFRAVGATPENTEYIVESLVGSSLAGHDSHGVIRIPFYVSEIKNGKLDPAAKPFVTHETPTTAIVDGANTFGQVSSRFAADLAARKAKESGVAVVNAVRCHHTGRLGEWVERVAADGMVGFAATGRPFGPYGAVPFGGAKGSLGTNPMAWAVPRADGQPPILLDFATTVIAGGKTKVAQAKGEELPPGAAVDKDGNPTTDMAKYRDGGALLTFAGHKGYGLSVMVELLAVGLGGGHKVPPGPRVSTLFIMAINPAAYGSQQEFIDYTESVAARLTSVPPAPGFDRVMLPGEPEALTRAARLREGVPVPERTWEDINRTVSELGLTVSA